MTMTYEGVVAGVRVVVGPRTVWIPFNNFYDAHLVAKILSEGIEAPVELWQGSVRTHVYQDGEAVREYEVIVQ